MRRSILAAIVALALAAAPLAAWAADSTARILADPEGFDGKAVTLYGKVTALKPRTSQQGNAYFTFALDDSQGTITVFSFGQPSCRNGVVATVEGVFHAVKKVGRYTFRNQVDATRIAC